MPVITAIIVALIGAAATIAAALIAVSWGRSKKAARPAATSSKPRSSTTEPATLTRNELQLLFARTLGVPDDYDLGDRPLSDEVARLQHEIDERLDEYAQPKMVAYLSTVQAEEADRPRTEMDRELDELIREAEKGGRTHEISVDINVGGLWRTRPSDVGTDNVITYGILQEQNGVHITHDHPQIGRTLSGRGVVMGHVVRIWYSTITGATGELQLEIPGLIAYGRFDLQGRWDSGHGRHGRITLTRT